MTDSNQTSLRAFQDLAGLALREACGPDDPTDVAERRDRFGEEAIEVLQALDLSEEQVCRLVRHVYSRPRGEPKTEMAQAQFTLAVLFSVAEQDMQAAADAELARIRSPEAIAKLRHKRSSRHGRGALPGHDRRIAGGGA